MNTYEQLGYLIIVSFIQMIIPILISFIVTFLGFKQLKQYDDRFQWPIKPYYSGLIWMILVFIFCLMTNLDIGSTIEKNNNFSESFLNGDYRNISYLIFLPDKIYWIIGSMIIPFLLITVDFSRPNHNSEIIKARARQKILQKPELIPFDYDKNIFVTGKNGAGKTVAILNFIQSHIENGEFCLIMDGKGDLGKYGLYDVCSKLAIKHNRPLYLINQSNPEQTHSYNPFTGCNATQIKDMLINMSSWSEEHYKALASEYWQAEAQFMIDQNEEINFKTLIQYSDPEYFMDMVNLKKESMDKDSYIYYRQIIESAGGTVISAKSRFSTIAFGIGRKLFSNNRRSFNLKEAYEKNGIVLVILNNLEYTDFARSVGRLVLDDVKNLIGSITRNNNNKKFLCVYDELSVYFDPMLVDIVNKSRSLGGCNILSTQTISDMDIISTDARRQIIGNMHGFYILKQADDLSAETLAKTIGTKKGTEITAKIDSYGKTGDGTSKIVDEFKIHPNDLKELPLEVGYWVDTMDVQSRPIRTKMKYVDVSDVASYIFKDLPEKKKEKIILKEK